MNLHFQAFESKHLPRLRQENSNMRLSQIKQMLHKYVEIIYYSHNIYCINGFYSSFYCYVQGVVKKSRKSSKLQFEPKIMDNLTLLNIVRKTKMCTVPLKFKLC